MPRVNGAYSGLSCSIPRLGFEQTALPDEWRLWLPAEEEPVLPAVPPLHHGGQDRLQDLHLDRAVLTQTAQQRPQTATHIWRTETQRTL